MISDNYRNDLNKWLDGGLKPRDPKNLDEALASMRALFALRNPEAFCLYQQLPKLRNGSELKIPHDLDPCSLR